MPDLQDLLEKEVKRSWDEEAPIILPDELREDPVIDAHRYTAVVAIHVHVIVTHHGQSFKAPLTYQTCTREASAAPAASF